MIYGVGTDVCDVRRIEAALARRGERFAEKVLGPHEIEVFRQRLSAVPARGMRSPRPIALENASLAEKRVAR